MNLKYALIINVIIFVIWKYFETNEFDVLFLFLADFGSVREELSVSFDVVDAVILEPASAMFLDLRR